MESKSQQLQPRQPRRVAPLALILRAGQRGLSHGQQWARHARSLGVRLYQRLPPFWQKAFPWLGKVILAAIIGWVVNQALGQAWKEAIAPAWQWFIDWLTSRPQR